MTGPSKKKERKKRRERKEKRREKRCVLPKVTPVVTDLIWCILCSASHITYIIIRESRRDRVWKRGKREIRKGKEGD